jgi:hypothetical protein
MQHQIVPQSFSGEVCIDPKSKNALKIRVEIKEKCSGDSF